MYASASIVAAYGRQGIHRTATDVDAPVTIQYSDGDIGDRISALAATHGTEITHRVPGDLRPVGEARNVFDSGGRYASVLGPGPWFHHEDDRWTHAVDRD